MQQAPYRSTEVKGKHQQSDERHCTSIPVKRLEANFNDSKNACSNGYDRFLSLRTNEESAYNARTSGASYPDQIENIAAEEGLRNSWTHNDYRNASGSAKNLSTSKSQEMSINQFGGFLNNHCITGYTQPFTDIHPSPYPAYLYNQATTSIYEVSH